MSCTKARGQVDQWLRYQQPRTRCCSSSTSKRCASSRRPSDRITRSTPGSSRPTGRASRTWSRSRRASPRTTRSSALLALAPSPASSERSIAWPIGALQLPRTSRAHRDHVAAPGSAANPAAARRHKLQLRQGWWPSSRSTRAPASTESCASLMPCATYELSNASSCSTSSPPRALASRSCSSCRTVRLANRLPAGTMLTDRTDPHTDYGTFMFYYPLRDIAAYVRDLLRGCEALHSIG